MLDVLLGCRRFDQTWKQRPAPDRRHAAVQRSPSARGRCESPPENFRTAANASEVIIPCAASSRNASSRWPGSICVSEANSLKNSVRAAPTPPGLVPRRRVTSVAIRHYAAAAAAMLRATPVRWAPRATGPPCSVPRPRRVAAGSTVPRLVRLRGTGCRARPDRTR